MRLATFLATLDLAHTSSLFSHINRIEPLPYAQLLDSEGLLVAVDNQVILRLPVLCFETPAIAADKQASPKKSKKRRSDAHQIDVQSISVQSQRASVVYLTIGRRQKKIAEAGRALLPAEGVVDCIQLQPGKFATLGTFLSTPGHFR